MRLSYAFLEQSDNLAIKSLHLAQHSAISGEVRIPGSKSLTNRALLLAALCEGTTRIRGGLRSEDTDLMKGALTQLGVEVNEDAESLTVVGNDGVLGREGDDKKLYLGLAGTAYRPLSAALSAGNGVYELDCSMRMRERPIAPLVNALRTLGAMIEYLDEGGFPRVRVTGGRLEGGVVQVPGELSSQYLSSLLLAAPLASNEVLIEVPGEQVSKPYVDMTIRLMEKFGISVQRDTYRRYLIRPGTYVSPGTCDIEADASSASYFLAAGAIAGKQLRITNLATESLQGDSGFADTLRQMGADIVSDSSGTMVNRAPLHGLDVNLNHMPDAAMTLAVTALFAEGATRISGIGNWRIKESDRLEAMCAELTKLGAKVKACDDSIEIQPPQTLRQARIRTYGDHRMAMCFSLVCFGTGLEIEHPQVVSKTFPDFFNVFVRLLC